MESVPEVSTTDSIDRLLVAMRPKLHRYCARMVGSAIDGEDVLQDALIKAVESLASAGPIRNHEGWLFRIAHNTALDFLRRRNRQEALRSGVEVDMIPDQLDAVASRQIASVSLRTFMRLPVAAAIERDPDGRARLLLAGGLRSHGCQPAGGEGRAQPRPYALARIRRRAGRFWQPELSDADRARLSTYVAHFNARDFDAIRAMIADDVRLELVSKTRLNGKAEVSRYFGNYDKISDWHLVAGLVEDRPAILVFDPTAPGSGPKYFMLLDWSADKVATIRDFRHAPYVIEGAEYRL